MFYLKAIALTLATAIVLGTVMTVNSQNSIGDKPAAGDGGKRARGQETANVRYKTFLRKNQFACLAKVIAQPNGCGS